MLESLDERRMYFLKAQIYVLERQKKSLSEKITAILEGSCGVDGTTGSSTGAAAWDGTFSSVTDPSEKYGRAGKVCSSRKKRSS